MKAGSWINTKLSSLNNLHSALAELAGQEVAVYEGDLLHQVRVSQLSE